MNVHPTKKEVHFLNEDGITDQIADTLQRSLASQSHSRVFEYQVFVPYCGLASVHAMHADAFDRGTRGDGAVDVEETEG